MPLNKPPVKVLSSEAQYPVDKNSLSSLVMKSRENPEQYLYRGKKLSEIVQPKDSVIQKEGSALIRCDTLFRASSLNFWSVSRIWAYF